MWRRLWPAVPADVRDDLAMLRIERLRAQVPTLYVATMLVVLTSMVAADPAAGPWIRFVFPLTLVGMCGARLIWWLCKRHEAVSPQVAERLILRTAIVGAVICLTASAWTINSWLDSIPGQRAYYPLFMIMGALAGGFCLSSTRFATLAVVATGVAPVLAALSLYGNHMDRIATVVFVIASLFLLRMIQQQHDQLVALLQMQRLMRQQAGTDALTGIGNRRALYARLEKEVASHQRVGLVLLDLDGFKPVNDAHGHATGDRLLCAVAGRLRDATSGRATAYRLGGDEFAIVANGSDDYDTQLMATSLLGSIAMPFDVGPLRLSIGACTGAAHSRPDDSIDSLIARADDRLYAAKALRYAGGRERRRTIMAGRPDKRAKLPGG